MISRSLARSSSKSSAGAISNVAMTLTVSVMASSGAPGIRTMPAAQDRRDDRHAIEQPATGEIEIEAVSGGGFSAADTVSASE